MYDIRTVTHSVLDLCQNS